MPGQSEVRIGASSRLALDEIDHCSRAPLSTVVEQAATEIFEPSALREAADETLARVADRRRAA
jgi:hypothetical protein